MVCTVPYSKLVHVSPVGVKLSFLSMSARRQYVSPFKAVSCLSASSKRARSKVELLYINTYIDTRVTHTKEEENEVSGVQQSDELRRDIWRCAAIMAFAYNTGRSTLSSSTSVISGKLDNCANEKIYSDSRLGASLCLASMFAVKFQCLITLILI